MALPKKHGLRKLQVGTTGYYWKLRNERDGHMAVVIGQVAQPSCRLTVRTNWFDPWLTFSDLLRPDTGIITPALVRKAIDYVLSRQWGATGARNLVLNYQNETFSIQTSFTNSI